MSTKTLTTAIVGALCLFAGLARADNDYMVEKGDSLIKIGNLFGVPYREIMKVNNLESTTIFPDQILRIPAGGRADDRDLAALARAAEVKAVQENTAVKKEPEFARVNVPGYSDVAAVLTKKETSYSQTAYIPPVQGASRARPTGPKAPETYTVREGDTIYNISRRFGVAAVELKKVNNIKFSNIQIGQVLTLPSKVSIAAN